MLIHSSQQLAEQKLLLLYIFNQLELPISNSQITDLVLENEIMNYFTFQQYLTELKEAAFIVESINEGNQLFSITDKGKKVLEYFVNRIPKKQIDFVSQLLSVKKKELIKSSEIKAEYIKLKDNEYIVTLKVIEKDVPMISIKLNVNSNRQAKQICEKWKNQAQNLYGKIITLLVD
jgi:predicted transcriptional regulator